jgi:hypothetical protein
MAAERRLASRQGRAGLLTNEELAMRNEQKLTMVGKYSALSETYRHGKVKARNEFLVCEIVNENEEP